MSMKFLAVIVGGVLVMASAAQAEQRYNTASKPLVIVAKDKLHITGGIHFDAGKSSIHKDSLPALNATAKLLAKNKMRLTIAVHSDSQGSSGYNKRMSEERANTISKYLVSRGLNAKRLIAHGFGETSPIADNRTAEGRAKNRRVEFLIWQGKIAAR